MSPIVKVCAVLLSGVAAFGYYHWYLVPKDLEKVANSYLFDIAHHKEWMDPSAIVNEGAVYLAEISSATDTLGWVYVHGKVDYQHQEQKVCKHVTFRYGIESVDNYEVIAVRNC
ncbi:hypothetical protein [Vibrio sp. LaRot3]|uniref:hypothetical protein n=1 Tax=Vibrio sp. LaRot3 TaxID=2998829 RepID=UPI0022CE21E6|nr:hypothetical protein [Vibrio sp. LaRot3]MDA0150178.1 hypothetical protein [Vibrio sp. LaRot3]